MKDKGRKSSGGVGAAFAAQKRKEYLKKKEKENPFDKFANAKKKHEVLNRRVKGEDRNVGRARKQAVETRKNRLFQDYQTSKKSNSFADRRFGESDATLSLEDKMFLRFQKERVKKARNASLFNLDGDDETDVLTHKGQVLKEGNMGDDDWRSDSDDERGSLGKDVVNSLHFGGGMVEKKVGVLGNPSIAAADTDAGAAAEGDDHHKKSRLDALQEIVMKSKMFKAQKKELKEEQENERDRLDLAFQELVSDSMVKFRPTKRDRSEDEVTGTNDFDDYDKMLKAMAFETKAQPADRTKSAEELAVDARKKLEDLEAARIRRMNADHNPEEEEATEALAGKGKQRRQKGQEEKEEGKKSKKDTEKDVKKKKARKTHITDDELDGSFGANYEGGDDDEVEDYANLTRRPAGDDADEEEDGDDDEEDESGDDDEEEEDGDDDEDDWEDDDVGPVGGKADDAVEEEGDEEEGDDDDEDEDGESDDDEEEGKGSGDEEEELPRAVRKRIQKADKEIQQLADEGVNDKMPHKLYCPATIEDFDEIKQKYVKNAVDFREIITRILAWNSVHLPGQEGMENRGKMHNFLDILLKVFIRMGDSLSICSDESIVTMQLDFLTNAIFKLSQDLAESSPPLWGRTLKLIESQLQKRIRDFVQGTRQSSWLSLGQLLLFRLLGHVFSVSDYRNSIVASASMILCQCITQCPVRTPRDVASGLLAVSILSMYTADASRLLPEAIEFLRSTIALFLNPAILKANKRPQSSSSSSSSSSSASSSDPAVSLEKQKQWLLVNSLLLPQKTFDINSFASLRASSAAYADAAGRIPWACFGDDDSESRESQQAAALLATAQTLLTALVQRHAKSSAFPEIFTPTLAVLRSLRPQDQPALSKEQQNAHLTLLETIATTSEQRKKTRLSLQWRKQVKIALEGKNPKFQVDYTFKKDLDPDSEKAKLKQLTRQVKREKKAAMRELRRDSEFIEQQRFKEDQEKKTARQEERYKNFAFMEEQQATINLQVRKGGDMLKGGGSGVGKKARVKR